MQYMQKLLRNAVEFCNICVANFMKYDIIKTTLERKPYDFRVYVFIVSV